MKLKLINTNLTKWIIIIVIVGILGLLAYTRLYTPAAPMPEEVVEADTKVIEADLLGIGTPQQVRVIFPETGLRLEVVNSGKIVATKTISPDQPKPSVECTRVKLNLNEAKDYLRCDEYTGPHHVETRLLTVHKGVLLTMPSGDFEKKVWYEPFWASRDKVAIGDIAGNGYAEIIEFVSEYPADAPRLNDHEIEQIIRREFDKQDISSDITDNVIAIANRENYGDGMGRKVIWGIHTFTDNETPLIRRLSGAEYDEIASKIISANQILVDEVNKDKNNPRLTEIIKITDLDQESIDFNNLVRNTFSYSKSYEYPMEHDD